MATSKKILCRKKKVDTKTVKITLPEELYYAVKSSAKNELRTISQQIRFFMELGIEFFNSQVQQQEGGEEQEEQTEAIGFRMDDPEECEEEEEEELQEAKKKKK